MKKKLVKWGIYIGVTTLWTVIMETYIPGALLGSLMLSAICLAPISIYVIWGIKQVILRIRDGLPLIEIEEKPKMSLFNRIVFAIDDFFELFRSR